MTIGYFTCRGIDPYRLSNMSAYELMIMNQFAIIEEERKAKIVQSVLRALSSSDEEDNGGVD
ncbi:hypothetical protein [uncultured Clostridium sp.]|uniref:hypothetical protein n=1 Tax=uncultured Clostridium sp. TaxID=59620 RepID=UPI0025D4F4FC|nr:hypothetical protein [uncultured Clostridium sp.]